MHFLHQYLQAVQDRECWIENIKRAVFRKTKLSVEERGGERAGAL
jgi:hypothetical protein